MTPQDITVHSLLLKAKAIEIEVAAMHSNDSITTNPYTEKAYLDKVAEMLTLSDELQQLARNPV